MKNKAMKKEKMNFKKSNKIDFNYKLLKSMI